VLGAYLHGLFHNEGLRRSILSELAARKGTVFRPGKVLSREEQYDRLAALVRSSLDIDFIYRTANLKRR
jgi:adenosylcobyric acid synthase